ncbi:MAG TPA: gas vesicle protein GvpG [Thermodesulfovibrionales bacterium]|nr:gas vesicle protein GvpG [Thermodesulfovibrionales bacterium]
MLLIDDLLMLPAKGFLGIFKEVQEMVERELSDETYSREKLVALQSRLELDEISEEEYNRKEKELLARIDAIRSPEEE